MNDVRVLLTGATGFLGAATLVQGLPPGVSGRWLLWVRGRNEQEVRARVQARLERFVRPEEAQAILLGCDVVPEDLTSLSHAAEEQLQVVTHVMHLAANTSFVFKRRVWDVNYHASLGLMERLRRAPRLQRIVYVGTASICGQGAPLLIDEDMFPRDGTSHLTAYTDSKSQIELALADRFKDLPIVVARPSIVVGHTRLGTRPSASIFWAIRAVCELGYVPCADNTWLDIVPVDWVASTLSTLLMKAKVSHTRRRRQWRESLMPTLRPRAYLPGAASWSSEALNDFKLIAPASDHSLAIATLIGWQKRSPCTTASPHWGRPSTIGVFWPKAFLLRPRSQSTSAPARRSPAVFPS